MLMTSTTPLSRSREKNEVLSQLPLNPRDRILHTSQSSSLGKRRNIKLRIGYDASATESTNQPSLNDCLHPGPPLQNLLWNVLVRACLYPVLLTGDLQKAFLQVCIEQEERDALRFHWKFKGHSEIDFQIHQGPVWAYILTIPVGGSYSTTFRRMGVSHSNQKEPLH